MGEEPVKSPSPGDKIKILFTLHNLGSGGVERHLLNLLEKIDYSHFQPYVCCLEKYGDFVEPIEKMGVEVVDLSIEKLYSARALIRICRLASYMRRRQIDIVHNFLFKSIVIGTFAAKLARIPVIINGRRDMGWAMNRRQRFLLNLTNRYCDKIIAVCEAVKQSVMEKEKIREDKIKVIYNGIDAEEFKPATEEKRSLARSTLCLKEGEPVVGTITHLTEVKGTEYLIRSAPLVLSEYPMTKFLVVGDGPLRKDLESLCVRMGVRDSFIFAGQRNDIQDMLSIMDVYVCPSLSEGHSNSILEAMATGRAVIATDVGGNREIIKNGTNGTLIKSMDQVALADSIKLFLGNCALAQEIGKQARASVVQNYELSKVVDQLLGYYISIYESKIVSNR